MSDSEAAPGSVPSSGRGKLAIRIAAIAILALGGVVLFDAIEIAERSGAGPQQSGFFPLLVGAGLLVFGVAFLVRATVWPDRALTEEVADAEAEMHWRTLILVGSALLVYVFVLDFLGYIVATTLFFVATAWLVGSRKVVRDLIIGVVMSVAIYFGFTEFLGVRLPAGVLEPLL